MNLNGTWTRGKRIIALAVIYCLMMIHDVKFSSLTCFDQQHLLLLVLQNSYYNSDDENLIYTCLIG